MHAHRLEWPIQVAWDWEYVWPPGYSCTSAPESSKSTGLPTPDWDWTLHQSRFEDLFKPINCWCFVSWPDLPTGHSGYRPQGQSVWPLVEVSQEDVKRGPPEPPFATSCHVEERLQSHLTCDDMVSLCFIGDYTNIFPHKTNSQRSCRWWETFSWPQRTQSWLPGTGSASAVGKLWWDPKKFNLPIFGW